MPKNLIAHAIAMDIIKFLKEQGFEDGVLAPFRNHTDIDTYSAFFDALWDRIEKALDKEEA